MNMFSPGCGCCKKCKIASDTFTRADNSDISTGIVSPDTVTSWTESSGSWEILSNQLKVTSANAIAICDTADTSGNSEARISAKVTAATSDDQAKLIVKYKDASNYWYGLIHFGAGGFLRLVKRVGGVETNLVTTVQSFSIATPYSLMACYGNGAFHIRDSVTGASATYSVTTTIIDHQQSALGTGALTSSILFDDFDYEHGFDFGTYSNPKVDCPVCSCNAALDTFDRTDSTDVNTGSNCGWTEVAGDWSIASSKLSISTTNAVIKCNTPYGSEGVKVTLNMGAATVPSVHRILINYVDIDNYWAGEFEWISGASTVIRLIERIAGVETVLVEYPYASLGPVSVCYDAVTGHLWASAGDTFPVPISGDGPAVTVLKDPPTSKYVGLGTGATVSAAILFDSFRADGSDTLCVPCIDCAYCLDSETMHEHLEVVFAGLTSGSCGSCSTLNSTPYILTLYARISADTCIWMYEFPSTVCGYKYIFAQTNKSGSNYNWSVRLTDHKIPTLATQTLTWTSANQATKLDCEADSGVACSYTSGTGICTATGTTATLSML